MSDKVNILIFYPHSPLRIWKQTHEVRVASHVPLYTL